MTMGNLVQATKDLVDTRHHPALDEAVKRRNFLAHRFWYERNYLMFASDGRERVIAELLEHEEFFGSLDAAISQDFQEVLPALGLSKEQLAEAMEAALSGQPDEPLPTRRYPGKDERVVRVWVRSPAIRRSPSLRRRMVFCGNSATPDLRGRHMNALDLNGGLMIYRA